MFDRFVRCASIALALSGSALRAEAQCLDWTPRFGLDGVWSGPLSIATVRSFASFDDGAGPALYVSGDFSGAGSVQTASIARWDGTSWQALGSGADGRIYALTVFDDGSGPALYAGGDFTIIGGVSANRIAKWDGSGWTALGSGVAHTDSGAYPGVYALAVFDDGSGPALYAGGEFDIAGASPAAHMARWDGSSWSPVGGGTSNFVEVLAVFDEGTGPRLFAGGVFTDADGTAVNYIARWDGSAWTGLGSGMSWIVTALAVFDDGTGPALYAGGGFTTAGGSSAQHVARWNGSNWTPLGSGMTGSSNTRVEAFASFDDGSGPRLYAGGNFSVAGGVAAEDIASWNGASWSSVGGDTLEGGNPGIVRALAAWDDGSGSDLYVGGTFFEAGGAAAYNVARWNSGWSALDDGGDGAGGPVRALAVYDDGQGAALYAGGRFPYIGSAGRSNVGRWDGSGWSALGDGVEGEVLALAVHDDGGPDLYAGGNIVEVAGMPTGRIARWDGSAWSTLGAGVGGFGGLTRVYAMVSHDDGSGPALYVGGDFSTAGGAPASRIARWNGSWSPVGPGLNGPVHALAVFDDGSGPALYAGGDFSLAGNLPVESVAKWNGSTWSPVGIVGAGGVDGRVHALLAADGSLYAGGGFSLADGSIPAANVARWNGTTWSAVGNGLGYPCPSCSFYMPVRSLTAFDDGLGPAVFAGGFFIDSGGTPLRGLAKWNGSSWASVGGGISGGAVETSVYALRAFDDGSGGGTDLYLGGDFGFAGGGIALNVARWLGCSKAPGTPFCFGDGSGAPCPCANSGSAGHGCQNSASTGGALLDSNGSTNPDTVVLAVTSERATALTIFLQGDLEIAPVTFGDGLRCVGGVLKRLYTKNAIGGAATAPQDGELPITERSAALGDPIAGGSMRSYMTYYRDPSATFCPAPAGNTFNSSNALRITW